ncbi:MAG: MFS transporter [Jatrophihabitantaceae bacterium]
MPRRGHLLTTVAHAGFRRLYAVRLLGQFGDGVFQASLAGAVLFNPERQASPGQIAFAFAVVLLPYSIVGPFVGVLLDRWWRQRVLVIANVLRAVAVLIVAVEIFGDVEGPLFYASALAVISVSRFFLSALSAALPHVVDPGDLVTANAFSTTSGAIATTAGGGLAVTVRLLIGASDTGYAVTAVAAIVPYLISAYVALPFERSALGPDDVERASRESLPRIARGLLAGARHVYARRPVFYALIMITVHRVCFGLWTVSTVLLYRNYFHGSGLFRSGLAGLAQVVALVAVGGGFAALVTPVATRRLGYVRWPALALVLSAIVQLACGLPYRLELVLLAALLLGFASQSVKIAVDTLVQQQVDDEFRGRVFAVYDTLFNIALVTAAVLTATLLPSDGHAPSAVIAVGAAYFLTAALYLWSGRRTSG